jgi:beta-lactam-binding protein with PASTA domain
MRVCIGLLLQATLALPFFIFLFNPDKGAEHKISLDEQAKAESLSEQEERVTRHLSCAVDV